MKVQRIDSVDLVRALAILAVVVLHTTPFNHGNPPLGSRLDLATGLDQLARFAVPCFFALSGFFWGGKIKAGPSLWAPTLTMARRVLFLFVAWSLIYLIPTNLYEVLQQGPWGVVRGVYWNLTAAMSDPLALVMQGTKVHLWFLMALLCSLLISALFLARGWPVALVIVASALYGIGVLGKAYAATPLGFQVDFNFRNGPFFGLLLFVGGYFLNRLEPHPGWLLRGLALMTVGYLIHFAELIHLHDHWGVSMSQDFVFGTVLVGMGATMVALSGSPRLSWRPLAKMGPWVLGIYAIHFAWVDLLSPLEDRYGGAVAWELGYPLIVFVLAILSAHLLGQAKGCRGLVR